MDTKRNSFRPLTEQELDTVQSEHQDTIITPFNLPSEKQQEEIKNLINSPLYLYLTNDPIAQKIDIEQEEIKYRIALFQEELEYTPIISAINQWLNQIEIEKCKKYASYIDIFFKKGILPKFFVDGQDFTVGGLRHMSQSIIVNQILQLHDSSEEQQDMLTCYKVFISHLNDISHGWFKRTLINLSNAEKGPTVEQEKFNLSDWRTFIDVLYRINQRDSIIVRCIMQGSARISEILDLTLTQVDWDRNRIKIREQDISVPFNEIFMSELKEYVETTANTRKNSPYIFITRTGKKLTRSRLNYSLKEASLQANVQKITPDLLKYIWSDLVQSGIKKETIMQSKNKIWKMDKNI